MVVDFACVGSNSTSATSGAEKKMGEEKKNNINIIY